MNTPAHSQTEIQRAVQERYAAIARGTQSSCCGEGEVEPAAIARAIGYSPEDLELGGDANLGVGCGNPLALAAIQPGMTVLDLGSGAGFDALLAWRRVGLQGRVIGVDFTDEMLEKARQNAARLCATNVEFRPGRIEALPLDYESVDLVISNCVVNLSVDKPAVFREIARVLRPGGQFAISDLVLLSPLPQQAAKDLALYVGCIAGASLLTDYLCHAAAAGLIELSVPQITTGVRLLAAMAGGSGSSCVPAGLANFVASAKFHGRKPAGQIPTSSLIEAEER